MMEQALLPPGYEEYNDLVRITSSPSEPIKRLKQVYYQFKLEEVKELIDRIKKRNEEHSFLLESEVKFLDKFVYVIRHLKGGGRLHFIKIKDCEELINLSLQATFDRTLDILEKIINKTLGKSSNLIEDKIIFSIRSNLRLLETLQEEKVDIDSIQKFKRLIYSFGIVLKNLISINAAATLTEEEADALLDDIIYDTSNIWVSYKKLRELKVPIIISQITE